MRVLEVISEAPPVHSGIATVAKELQNGLEALGHEVNVVSLQQIPRWCFGEVRISSMSIKLPWLLNEALNYDVVHLHGPVPTFSDVFLLGWNALPGPRPPLVYTHHSQIDLPKAGPLDEVYTSTHLALAKIADHITVTTPSYARIVARYLPHNHISVIPWGANRRFVYYGPKPDPFTVLFVGQMRPYKGVDLLLQALKDVKNVRVDVVGNGAWMKSYQRLATALGADHVTFHGRVSDERLAELFARAHVIVLPSRRMAEAFGIVLLEGMSAGCVPVASNLPGVRDVAGLAGLTFPVNDVEGLRDAILRLRDDRQLWRRLSEKGRVIARRFTWEATSQQFHALFTALQTERETLAVTPSRAYLPDFVFERVAVL